MQMSLCFGWHWFLEQVLVLALVSFLIYLVYKLGKSSSVLKLLPTLLSFTLLLTEQSFRGSQQG